MSFRAWVIAVAFGLAAIGCPIWLEAQAIQQGTESHRQEARQEQAPIAGIPIRILEEPEQTESSKREQREASQREIEDLQAQKLSAESSYRAFWLGAVQTILAALGTIALVYSLLLNRRATKAAQDAVTAAKDSISVSREIGEAQTRAYLGREGCAAWEGVGIEFSGEITNCGNSPALNVYMMLGLIYWEEIGKDTHSIGEIFTQPMSLGSIKSNGSVSTGRVSFAGFLPAECSKRSGTFDVREAKIYLLGADVFGKEVSYIGGIGFFSGFDEYSKKKAHPSLLAPFVRHGNSARGIEAMRDWVEQSHR